MGSEVLPLFETRVAKGRLIYRLFAATVFVGIVLIWIYRATQIIKIIPKAGKLGYIGVFVTEMWLGLYWILTQSHRWNRTYRYTFKDSLSRRYENILPKVDIFVCTADPVIEPPIMVINTVLSVMAYDYPQDKLSVYLSDDAGSDLTFYALTEASCFAKYWIPFCNKYKIEPRSPAAYFISADSDSKFDANQAKELVSIKKLYEDMENRITAATKLGRIPENIRLENKGFSQGNSFSSRGDHDTILQILIDGKDPNAKDIEGCILPTLVYLAREKRPTHFHNFKAGAMNALIRVSSEISNGKILLNVDCDMYSNNSQSVRDALCFFIDEEKGHEIAYVQFPQNFDNVTKNEVYSSTFRVINKVEFHGLDGYGGPLYIGTGCFHRRDTLCGKEFNKDKKIEWRENYDNLTQQFVDKSDATLKALAACTSEDNTQWGKEMGLRYGCLTEDVITGLSIQCKGWKSIYYNPTRAGFLGVAPTSLDQTLIQHKRWSEGDLQILLSKFSPPICGIGKISPGLILGYCTYCLWAPNSFAVLFYSIVPSLYLLRDVPLFPQVSSPWIIPFAYVAIATYAYSVMEFLWSGGTMKGWWNDQRMWLYKRTTSYLFACVDTILSLTAGLAETKFIVTNKVSDPEVASRYEKEMMEFGTDFPMFTVLATVSMLNLFSLVWVLKGVVIGASVYAYEYMVLQIVLCGVLVLINFPIYEAMFVRKDAGKMPGSITVKSVILALSICTCSVFWG